MPDRQVASIRARAPQARTRALAGAPWGAPARGFAMRTIGAVIGWLVGPRSEQERHGTVVKEKG